jgi:hypothetical protein
MDLAIFGNCSKLYYHHGHHGHINISLQALKEQNSDIVVPLDISVLHYSGGTHGWHRYIAFFSTYSPFQTWIYDSLWEFSQSHLPTVDAAPLAVPGAEVDWILSHANETLAIGDLVLIFWELFRDPSR